MWVGAPQAATARLHAGAGACQVYAHLYHNMHNWRMARYSSIC